MMQGSTHGSSDVGGAEGEAGRGGHRRNSEEKWWRGVGEGGSGVWKRGKGRGSRDFFVCSLGSCLSSSPWN